MSWSYLIDTSITCWVSSSDYYRRYSSISVRVSHWLYDQRLEFLTDHTAWIRDCINLCFSTLVTVVELLLPWGILYRLSDWFIFQLLLWNGPFSQIDNSLVVPAQPFMDVLWSTRTLSSSSGVPPPNAPWIDSRCINSPQMVFHTAHRPMRLQEWQVNIRNFSYYYLLG